MKFLLATCKKVKDQSYLGYYNLKTSKLRKVSVSKVIANNRNNGGKKFTTKLRQSGGDSSGGSYASGYEWSCDGYNTFEETYYWENYQG